MSEPAVEKSVAGSGAAGNGGGGGEKGGGQREAGEGGSVGVVGGLVAKAQGACAERGRLEEEIAAEHASAISTAESVYAAAVKDAERTAAAARERVLGEYEAGAGAALERAQAERRAASMKRATARSIAEEKAGAELGEAKKKLDDRLWLAESLFDNSKDKPRQAFEASKKRLTAEWAGVQSLGAQAAHFLSHCRMGPLVVPERVTPEAAEEPKETWEADEAAGDEAALAGLTARSAEKEGGEEDAGGGKPAERPAAGGAVGAFARSVTEVQRATAALAAFKLPRLFGGAWAVFMALTVGVLAGTGLAWLDVWAWSARIAWGAGIAAVLTGAGLWWLWRWTKRRCRPKADALGLALAKSKAAHEAALAEIAAVRTRQERAIWRRREREQISARQAYAAVEEKVKPWMERELGEADERYTAMIEGVQDVLSTTLERLEGDRDALLAVAEERRATALGAAQERRSAAIDAAETRRAARFAEMAGQWRRAMTEVAEGAAALRARVDAANRPWAELDAGGGADGGAGPAPIRLASVELDLRSTPGGLPTLSELATACPEVLRLPVSMDATAGDGCVLIEHTPEKRAAAIASLQQAALRALLAYPSGKTRFVLIDPVGLGQSFAGMMHLADHNPQLVADRIWTEPRHIEQRLTDLTEHMENVIQKYLRNEFADIEAYNAFAGEVAEPYRFLVIADYPNGFSDQACARLASILASGPRCGVFTLLSADVRAKPAGGAGSGLAGGGLSLADIERRAVTLTVKKERTAVRSRVLAGLPVSVDGPPEDELFGRLVHEAGARAKDAGKVQVPFATLLPGGVGGGAKAELMWTGDTTAELKIPLGRLGASKLQYLTLGRGTAQHALIAGRTGSGKSTLMNVLITAAGEWFSPDQLELYLIDFKKGVEFKAYAAHGLPHARVIAIESEREFGLSVLRRLDEELKRRGEAYRAVGAQDLAGYRRAMPGERMPRVLLMVDEFQELFVEDDKVGQEAGLLLDRLVRQGRAFGLHVLLGSQTLAGAYSLARATMGQMGVRIALACSEADSYVILSEDNAAARLLSRPGEAIYNDKGGMLEGNSPFQIAWLGDAEREKHLEAIAAKARGWRGGVGGMGVGELAKPVVFEGNRAAELLEAPAAAAVLRTPVREEAGGAAARVLLGEAVAIKDPTAAVLSRQSGGNLLMVGQREEQAAGMLAAATAQLLARHPVGRVSAGDEELPRVTLLDGLPTDSALFGRVGAAAATWLERTAEGGAGGGGARAAGLWQPGYRDAETAVGLLYAELQRRMAAGDVATPWPAVYLVVVGAQRFRALRKGEDDFGMSFGDGAGEGRAVPADKQLLALLRDGPTVGMFGVLWYDTVASLDRSLPRGTLREFDSRVVMQMSASDSAALIDAPSAGTLGANRALLFVESQGTIEKFRPWRLPE
jgi:S-DNA-T family DNA segregation ATPase FtsK/SpoIIIE